METVRCGEALLRSSQPLLSFLAPAARSSASSIPRQCRAQRRQWQPSRSFTTTQCRRQPPADDDRPSPSRSHPSTPPSSQETVTDDISSLLESSLDFSKSTPTAPASRTSHYPSREAQARNPIARHMEKAKASQSSGVDDVLNNIMSRPKRQASAPRFSSSDIESMIAPRGNQNDHLTRDQPELESPPMKLGPTVGRTVNVNTARGMDVGRAFRQLEILCARNQVRKDFMKQRFHERPGLKRKRLKSERWRKNFKANFKETVALVQKMRKQGW